MVSWLVWLVTVEMFNSVSEVLRYVLAQKLTTLRNIHRRKTNDNLPQPLLYKIFGPCKWKTI